MRGLVTLLAVVLLGLAGWFLFARDAEPSLDAASREVRVSETKPEFAPADLSTPDAEARVETPDAIPASAEPATPEIVPGSLTIDPATTTTRPRVTIEGSVVLIDVDENRFEEESGSMSVAHEKSELGTFEIPIESGRFSFETEAGATFELRDVVLGGESCGLGRPARGIVAEAGVELPLEVYRRVPATLLVRDKTSRHELSGIEVWNRAEWEFSDPLNPSEASGGERVLENQSSPIRLPERDGRQAWWVGVEGYAWERVDFDHRFGGERVVLLEREATLTVHLEGFSIDRVHALRLKLQGYSFGSGPGLVQRTGGAARVSAKGLREGTWIVEAITEATEDEALVLGSVTATLSAGETSTVTLLLDAEKRALEAIEVSGTLELPPGAGKAVDRLDWTPIGEPAGREETYLAMPNDRGDLFAWQTGTLTPGAWDVEVRPFGHVERVVIGATGASGIAIRVAPLAEILVEVRDFATGEALNSASVNWSRIDGEESHYAGGCEAMSETGQFLVRARPGVVKISASAPGRSGSHQELTVHSGRQSIALDLHESLTAVLTLKDGTTVVKTDIAWWLGMSADAIEGDGGVTSYSFDGSEIMTAELTEPGMYRFTFSDVEGYLPIEPIEMRMERGETRIEVQLVRE